MGGLASVGHGGCDESALVSRLRAAGCVFAEDEAHLLVAAAGTPEDLESRVARRVAGEPLEHVLGWAAFRGRRVSVDPGVFVPRRRTELLVSEAVARVRPGALVVDLCCGTGAVGAAVAMEAEGVALHATDLDEAAVACAARNVAAIGGKVHHGDLFAALPQALRGRVDLVVANAPYVPTGDLGLLPPEARDHEPESALDGGPDGLDVQRRIARAAPAWLAASGLLLVETSVRQAPESARILAEAGLVATIRHSDAHDATVVVGSWER